MKLTQFGYNALVAGWLVPLILSAFWGNAHNTGAASDFYAGMALVCIACWGYAGWSIYTNKPTVTGRRNQTRPFGTAEPAAAEGDTILNLENLGAFKWVYCLLITVLATVSAIIHYKMNRDASGFLATLFLIYAVLDALIAVLSFNQFWAIKSGQIRQLQNTVASSMFDQRR